METYAQDRGDTVTSLKLVQDANGQVAEITYALVVS